MKEHGLVAKNMQISETALQKIIREYTREAGVRNLEREIANVCRKIVKKVVDEGKKYSCKVSPSSLYDMLGIPKYQKLETIEPLDIGVATGMAWTEFGGDLLSIEVSAIPGKGKMVPTGTLGDVMKESSQAAMTYVRSRAADFGLAKTFYQNVDIHLHIPEGAVPKDGPSAGITMAVALVSALAKTPVRHDLTMTGELTLTGKVLPIGGLKEKVLAAHRAGITHIIIPKDNEKDIPDIPKKIQNALTFHPVSNMDKVIELAFEKNFKPSKKKTSAKKPTPRKSRSTTKQPSATTLN
jgi:ATP-dependent Lon protease